MNSVPESVYPLDAEGFEHPHWCDQTICTSPSTLRIRGEQEASVPFILRDAHLGTPKVVDGDHYAETKFSIQPWRMVDQPVTDEVEGVDLHAEAKDERHRAVYPVTVSQLSPLARAFAEVRDIATAGKPPTIVQRAVSALFAFGTLDSSEAARLLPLWRDYRDLTPAEVDDVVTWFVDGTDEFRRTDVDNDDSNSGPGWPFGGAL